MYKFLEAKDKLVRWVGDTLNPVPDAPLEPEVVNEKLVRAKERRARLEREKAEEEQKAKEEPPGPLLPDGRPRLPRGQRLTQDFPVLDLGATPTVHLSDFAFSVGGAVARPQRWTWDEFLKQPQTVVDTDIHCVTSWSKFDTTWRGLSAVDLIKIVQPRPDARFVMLRSYDGYSTNLSMERFSEEDVLLAYQFEGKPIDPEHGGPVRAVVPKLYFWKSAKWLRHITFMSEDQPGYWEARGYHNEGDPWKEQRYKSSDED